VNLRQSTTYRKRIYKTGTVVSVGPTAAKYLVIVLLGVFSLLFIVQTAQGSDMALQIRNENDAQSIIEQELTTLEVQSSRLQTLEVLKKSAASQRLVPIGETSESIVVK